MINTKLSVFVTLVCLSISVRSSLLDDIRETYDEIDHNVRGGLDWLDDLYSDNPFKPDLGCIAKHCWKETGPAMIDPMFYKDITCSNGCTGFYYNDTTPEKLTYQNCTTKCALTYESEAVDNYMACSMNHNCISFPPIDVTCPVEKLTAAVDPESSLASMEGEWWQHYGKNALWDCYPCQHIHGMNIVNDPEWCGQTVSPIGKVEAPCFNYTYSYDLYTTTGSKYFGQTWQLPSIEKGKPIDIYYEYMGTWHNETWYILSAKENYIVLVDCSYMESWTNLGSILWVKPGYTLSDSDHEKVSEVYMNALGWSYPNDFCYDRHGDDQCDGPDGNINSGNNNFKFINN